MTEKEDKPPEMPWNVAGLVGSLGAFVTGITLMLDDAKDFGLIGVERDPPVPHHGFIGTLLMLGGLAGLGFSLLDLLSKTPPPILTEQTPPESFLKQAVPLNHVLKKLEEPSKTRNPEP